MQSHPQIDDLKREFADVAIKYSRVCRQIGSSERELDELKKQASLLKPKLDAHKDELDARNRLIDKYRTRGKMKKAQSKEPRRDIALGLYIEVLEKLKEIDNQQERFRKILRRDKLIYSYDEIKRRYHNVRHNLMVAILAAESEDDELREYKARIMRSLIAAQYIPQETAPDQVLYYERNGRIHAFYGGRAYGSVEQSPDGIGHSHSKLDATRRTTDGLFVCMFNRPPK